MGMENKRAARCANTETAQGNAFNDRNSTGNGASAQRQRLKAELQRRGSLTTIQCRHELDIISPAPRILELRRRGCRIDTVRVRDFTPEGRPHSVARYVWQGEGGDGL